MEYIDRNHNCIAPKVYAALENLGIRQTSRNGPVLRMPRVTTLVALCPRERVNFCPARDANPFFHLVEAMAMLAAENSVELLAYCAKNMRSFTDDGERYNAFYGTRLRETWGDQLDEVIKELTARPDSRQAVAQMWDPADLTKSTKDKACNLCLLFQISAEGRLEMTSFNRSNDAVWGILSGANTVHLSFFQEYVACALGLECGAWVHVSNNLHVYTDRGDWEKVRSGGVDYYSTPADIQTGPKLFNTPAERKLFDIELRHTVKSWLHAAQSKDITLVQVMHQSAQNEFLHDVAIPVFMAWHLRKVGAPRELISGWVQRITAPDWRLACAMWINRRAHPTVLA